MTNEIRDAWETTEAKRKRRVRTGIGFGLFTLFVLIGAPVGFVLYLVLGQAAYEQELRDSRPFASLPALAVHLHRKAQHPPDAKPPYDDDLGQYIKRYGVGSWRGPSEGRLIVGQAPESTGCPSMSWFRSTPCKGLMTTVEIWDHPVLGPIIRDAIENPCHAFSRKDLYTGGHVPQLRKTFNCVVEAPVDGNPLSMGLRIYDKRRRQNRETIFFPATR